jgi:TPR repeat protein
VSLIAATSRQKTLLLLSIGALVCLGAWLVASPDITLWRLNTEQASDSAEVAALRVKDWNAGDLETLVLESRNRFAALEAPLPAPYQCPTPAPKSEFEPTVAFDARLARAQQACTDGARQGEQALQAERTRRASLTETPLTLPLWNTTAQYDAEREVFLVHLLKGRDYLTLTLGITADRSVSARADDVLPGRAWVCEIPVSLADAPTWRASTTLLLSFRLASASPLSVTDAGLVLLDGRSDTATAATSLTQCASEIPSGYQGEALGSSGVPQDPAQVVADLRTAADQGEALAQHDLGAMYFRGEGVPKDYAQAMVWVRTAADQGYAEAQDTLGWIYANGQGVPQRDTAQAGAWFRKAADQGHVAAQFTLGYAYANGLGVPQDHVQAVAWYRQAAEQGHADAQSYVGDAYHYGEGVPEDYAQAVSWYRQAAEQGLAAAQFSLGNAYFYGEGVPEDDAQAMSLFRQAADQDYRLAMLMLSAGSIQPGMTPQEVRKVMGQASPRTVNSVTHGQADYSDDVPTSDINAGQEHRERHGRIEEWYYCTTRNRHHQFIALYFHNGRFVEGGYKIVTAEAAAGSDWLRRAARNDPNDCRLLAGESAPGYVRETEPDWVADARLGGRRDRSDDSLFQRLTR